MISGRSRLDIGTEGEGYKSVGKVAPLEIYLAGNIVDGNGDTIPSRVVCRIKGTKKFFFLFPKGSEEEMRSAAPWLQKELERVIDGPASDATPDDMGSAVPSGSPL